MVDNFSDELLTTPKATFLGVAEQIAEPLLNRINAESKSDKFTRKTQEETKE
jgi:hypothetical protein